MTKKELTSKVLSGLRDFNKWAEERRKAGLCEGLGWHKCKSQSKPTKIIEVTAFGSVIQELRVCEDCFWFYETQRALRTG